MKDYRVATTGNPGFRTIYKLAGCAAWAAALLTVGEVVLFTLFPQPEDVADWFALFQQNRILGLLEFWGLEIPMYLCFVLVFLGLFQLMKESNESWMVIALILVLLGTAVFLATNNPFGMLSLSRQHASVNEPEKEAALLAAGEALVAITEQRAVGGFNMALLLVSTGGLIASTLMMQSRFFSRSTALAGLLAFALSFADYLRQALTDAPAAALLIILPNVLLLVFWLLSVGRTLFRLDGCRI